MGTTNKGYLTQNFKIRFGVEDLAFMIAEQIKNTIANDKAFSNVEIEESYFEDDELVINGSYVTRFEHWHCDRTLESPEEDEMEREYIGNHPWLIADLPKEIKENISILEVKEDDDINYPQPD